MSFTSTTGPQCMHFRRIAFFLWALLAANGARADADSAVAFVTFGLEGVWSPDCGKPASQGNPRVFWQVASDGSIFHGVTFDDTTWGLIDTVSGAAILRDNLIRFTVIRNGSAFSTAIIERVNGKIHAVSSIGSGGEVYVQGGIFVATGQPALYDERCDLPVPIS